MFAIPFDKFPNVFSAKMSVAVTRILGGKRRMSKAQRPMFTGNAATFVTISLVSFSGIFIAIFIPKITFASDSLTRPIVVFISGDISFFAASMREVFHGVEASFAFKTAALFAPEAIGFAKGFRYLPTSESNPSSSFLPDSGMFLPFPDIFLFFICVSLCSCLGIIP